MEPRLNEEALLRACETDDVSHLKLYTEGEYKERVYHPCGLLQIWE